jgi:hypothetical protein
MIEDFYTRYKMIFKKYNINNIDDIKLYFNTYINKDFIDSKLDIDYNYIKLLNISEKNNIIYLNPYYVDKFGLENYYVDNMIFLCNREYIDFFRNFNNLYFDYEIDTVFKTNNPYDKIFGILINILNGLIIGIDVKKNDSFEFIEHKNYYIKDNIFEKIKQKSKICIPINKATTCIFLDGDLDDIEINTILFQYVKLLILNNVYIDFYILNHNHINDINDILDRIKTNYNFTITNANYYVGNKLQKKYNICLAMTSKYLNFAIENNDKINKICFIPELNINLDKLDNIDKIDKIDKKIHYICEYEYQKFKLKNTNTYLSTLYVLPIFYNMNLQREKSIIFKFDDNYDYDKKSLMESIINILSDNKIKCYVYGNSNLNNNTQLNNNSQLNNNYIINLSTLSNIELNKYYNKCMIGCVFSDKYNDKTAHNMLVSGLKVIEYNNKITSFDLPSFIFTKISSSDNIFEIVDELTKSNDIYNNTCVEYLNKYNNFSIESHINDVSFYLTKL